MQMKKTDRTIQSIKHSLNHSLLWQILEAARRIDQAKDLLNEGRAELALKLVLPLAVDSKVLSMAEQASDLAITALDDLIDDCLKREDFKTALKYLDEWIKLKPLELYPLILKGEILYFETDDLEAAYQVFRQVVRLCPNCLEGWIYLADIECSRKHYRKAARYLIRAWQILNNIHWGYPVTASVVTNIFESLYGQTARLLALLGDEKGAKAVIKKGMEVTGSRSNYLNKILQWIEEESK